MRNKIQSVILAAVFCLTLLTAPTPVRAGVIPIGGLECPENQECSAAPPATNAPQEPAPTPEAGDTTALTDILMLVMQVLATLR